MQFGLEINPTVPLYNHSREYNFSPSPPPERNEVAYWVRTTKPVFATCKRCGERDLMDDPVVGLYADPPHLRIRKPTPFSVLDACDTVPPVGIFSGRDCLAERVRTWVPVVNPVIGTCRHCGHRGVVDRPSIGLYY